MKIKLIRKIKQRIRDISNVWSVAGIRNVYVMAILPHFGSKSTRDIRRERKQQAILHYLQTNYQNLILKYTQKKKDTPSLQSSTYMGLLVARRKCDATYSTKLLSIFMLTCWQSSGSPYYTRNISNMLLSRITSYERFRKEKSHLLIFQIFSVCVCSMSMEAYG